MNLEIPIAEFLVKMTILTLALQLALWLMRNKSASARHSAIKVGWFSLLALPVLMAFLPTWGVPGWNRENRVFLASPDISTKAGIATPFALNFGNLVLSIWLIGFLIGIFRIGFGLWVLRDQTRHYESVENLELSDRAREIMGDRQIEIRIGGPLTQPMTWGHRHPVIILPSDAGQWTEKRLKAILSHEIAHVKRRDWLNTLLANFVASVYWYHPLVWLIFRQFANESERAADDQAILTGCAPVDYAYHLLETARNYREQPRALGIAMAKGSPLKARLNGVLSKRNARNPLSPGKVRALAVVVMAVGVIVATGGATLKTFPQTVATSSAILPESKEQSPSTETWIPAIAAMAKPKPLQSQIPTRRIRHMARVSGSPRSETRRSYSARSNSVVVPQSESNPSERELLAMASQIESASKELEASAQSLPLSESTSEVPAPSKPPSIQMTRGNRSRTVTIREIHVNIPEIKLNRKGISLNIPSIHIQVPQFKIELPKKILLGHSGNQKGNPEEVSFSTD